MRLSDKYHKKQLELLRLFADCCDNNNISYFLCGGTLLGAIRNNELIPWDDDMDVVVFYHDKDRLIDALKSCLEEPYELDNPFEKDNIYYGGFIRLRDESTTASTYWELANNPSDRCGGIWLDILFINELPNNKLMEFLYRQRIRNLQGLRMTKSFYGQFRNNWCITDSSWRFYRFISPLFSTSFLEKQLKRLQSKHYKSPKIASLARHPHMKQTIILNRTWFETKRTVKLGEYIFSIPQNAEDYLAKVYGKDFLLPPKDIDYDRHGILIADTEIPYKKMRELYITNNWKKDYHGETIVLFGSGQQADYYIKHEDSEFIPQYIADNNPTKWNTDFNGVPVISPDALKELSQKQELRIIIATVHFLEISAQLREMNITDYYLYINSQAWEK